MLGLHGIQIRNLLFFKYLSTMFVFRRLLTVVKYSLQLAILLLYTVLYVYSFYQEHIRAAHMLLLLYIRL